MLLRRAAIGRKYRSRRRNAGHGRATPAVTSTGGWYGCCVVGSVRRRGTVGRKNSSRRSNAGHGRRHGHHFGLHSRTASIARTWWAPRRKYVAHRRHTRLHNHDRRPLRCLGARVGVSGPPPGAPDQQSRHHNHYHSPELAFHSTLYYTCVLSQKRSCTQCATPQNRE